MPMPVLDPTRFVPAVLADPTHKLPLPDKGGRLFLAAGETVDSWDPFYSHLLGDGSLRLKPAEAAAEPVTPPAPSADEPRTDTPPADEPKVEAPPPTEVTAPEAPTAH